MLHLPQNLSNPCMRAEAFCSPTSTVLSGPACNLPPRHSLAAIFCRRHPGPRSTSALLQLLCSRACVQVALCRRLNDRRLPENHVPCVLKGARQKGVRAVTSHLRKQLSTDTACQTRFASSHQKAPLVRLQACANCFEARRWSWLSINTSGEPEQEEPCAVPPVLCLCKFTVF